MENENLTNEANGEQEQGEKPAKLTRKQQFLQVLKFTAFSASAGVIQFLTTTTLHEWTGWLIDYYWLAFAIGLTLSVIWNFTFNRKFTFKAANNIPLAMGLVAAYNLILIVPLSIGGYYLERLWGSNLGMVVTVINMLINFVTEFFWDKFVVFNGKVTAKLEKLFRRKKA